MLSKVDGDLKTKTCTKCLEVKDLSQFYKASHMKDGKNSICRVCIRIRLNAHRKLNPQLYKNYDKKYYAKYGGRLKRYGLSKAEYTILLHLQGSACAICKTPDNGKLYIDHDHATGNIRGLLCNRCNAGLGMFKDSSTVLLLAISYLSSHGK